MLCYYPCEDYFVGVTFETAKQVGYQHYYFYISLKKKPVYIVHP